MLKPFAAAIALGAFLSMSAQQPARDPAVPYPTDYRTWAVVKSVMVGPQSKVFATRGGFHHFYANSKAMEGYRTGQFPDGSVIVDEGVHVSEVQGNTVQGARRSVEVMHKDSTAYSATGSWGFERFEADSQTSVADGKLKTACFTCHATKKDRDYVFSSFRP